MTPEQLIEKFNSNPTLENGINILSILTNKEGNPQYNIANMLARNLIELYPYNVDIISILALCAYETGEYRLSYNLYEFIRTFKNIDEGKYKSMEINQMKCVEYICDEYTNYYREKVSEIMNRPKRNIKTITFSITTCKRLNLFEKTMNSFLNCCTDATLIDEWICVDDNSSEEDRKRMTQLYPFMTFHFKDMVKKGHPQSMNMILDIVKTPYLFHMEDDWKFFHKTNYIQKCLDGITLDKTIGQCLINKNYAEVTSDIRIVGGVPIYSEKGDRFMMHEYTRTASEKSDFFSKYGSSSRHCSYWPHYSLRPSLIKTKVFKDIGRFSETKSHFEMEYSHRYDKKGYVSIFLDGIYSIHIGRLTSERNNGNISNAYELNNEKQFSDKGCDKGCDKEILTNNMKTFVVNLNRRKDRLEKFQKISPLKCERFDAVDGKLLKPNIYLQRIFENNNYNMRDGIVGCALSHIKLAINCVNSKVDTFCILEDDVTFVHDFLRKFKHVLNNLPPDWDMIYLGHILSKNFSYTEMTKKDLPILEKWSKGRSLRMSLGGTHAYMINKKGSEKLLEFINKNGMTNAIDTVQQKSIGELNVYYCNPRIVLSNHLDDTDIQNSFKSLSISETITFKEDGSHRLKKNGMYTIEDALQYNKDEEYNKYIDMFKFFPCLDQENNDLYYHREDVHKSMIRCMNDDKCVGFNTLGFFKSKITQLGESRYFGEKDGIFIKKSVLTECICIDDVD